MDITNMWKEITGIIATVGIVYAWIKAKIKKWKPIIEPMIKEAEQRAMDGVIDKADRKAIVMEGIKSLEANGTIKLNFITRLIVSKVVDRLAEKLPDFKINK